MSSGFDIRFDPESSDPWDTTVTPLGDATTPIDYIEAARALLIRAESITEETAVDAVDATVLAYRAASGASDVHDNSDTLNAKFIRALLTMYR